jgi:hypothetical protein
MLFEINKFRAKRKGSLHHQNSKLLCALLFQIRRIDQTIKFKIQCKMSRKYFFSGYKIYKNLSPNIILLFENNNNKF